jgi:hypothetical protein
MGREGETSPGFLLNGGNVMRVHRVMECRKSIVAFVIFVLCGWTATDALAAQAGQVLLNGRVKSIDLSVNTVVVSDYDGKDVTLSIEDKEILVKFKNGLIKIGDDVNVKYRIKDDKKIPFSFRKTAGC